MRTGLTVLFATILAAMLAVTSWASLERSVFDAGYLFGERWFTATFCDAYFGFLTFYVWVAYKETSQLSRVGWFIALMALGNIAIAVYMLLQLFRLRPGASCEDLLLRRKPSPASR